MHLPTARLVLVLLREPRLKRGEVVEDGRRIHLPLPGQLEESVLPGLARAERKHVPEGFASCLVAIDGTLVQRTFEVSRLAQRSMKLKLQHRSQEVTHVGHV